MELFSYNDTLYQINTSQTLCNCIMDSNHKLSELLEQGDFGFGATAGMQENIVLFNGKIISPKENISSKKIAISFVSKFFNEKTLYSCSGMNIEGLREYIECSFQSKNYIYLFKLKSEFDFVKISHFPKFQKPYVKITPEIVNQSENEILSNISGYLMGFWLPSYLDCFNSGAGGCHIHFISDDMSVFGHVLECQTSSFEMQLCQKNNFELVLPCCKDFNTSPFIEDKQMNSRISDWAKLGKGGI
ncbi:acetolactate decarboxylase [Vibrio sp. MEBiC08052]|uniref:acetolactate decarboxylase n=1 Tax=Vibrio sp. MEBiC08052 TaxID=1761910 RepID=UPI00074081EE|nr:acetolactate decarboxylase [Vibrio sp. MEBiC08052]KUI99675.1 hypothetical protein VRK_11210 [Vibrio sp. MEBiC08052]